MCPSGDTVPPSQEPTRVSVSHCRQAFEVLDTDRDGKISRDDLRSFYARFPDASDEDIGSMIWVADFNKDGFVEYDEFKRVLGCDCRRSSPHANWVMEDMFKIIDKDGDGKVGFEDLRIYMNWVGISATDEDIWAMIRLGGADGKEGISYEGVLKILAVG
ncbi:PREDICTED: calmodulin-related protein 97A-like [Nelumbo nucifera]|uniref:Calmodulin-related protein 97A-like n=2 Tax=Nelumbo nucifera TaxID=4432 RepID=A0A1U8AF06_NELNU|nr:PREDICTED: calmodulin-related protein 97A-like [Nelumbo nucifera]DAD22711.1 TPA_asm: hypothetical protein HUJ06_024174 [Nelumbo nucifera]